MLGLMLGLSAAIALVVGAWLWSQAPEISAMVAANTSISPIFWPLLNRLNSRKRAKSDCCDATAILFYACLQLRSA